MCFALIGVALSREGVSFRQFLSKRYLLPYGVAATFIFLSYLVIISGLELDYAIPATFIVMGILVLAGLRRFAVNATTLSVLLICILIFGNALSGIYTVTSIHEYHYITIAQVPNVNTINLNVSTLQGNIKLYFNNDTTNLCHIDFVKEYGPVSVGPGMQYISKSGYNDYESPSTFNFTTING